MAFLNRVTDWFRRDPATSSTKSSTFSTAAGSTVPSWYRWGAGNHTGVAVTPDTALGSSAVYAAVRAISQDVAKLPARWDHALPRGGWVRDTTHDLNRLLSTPNPWQTWVDFIEYVVANYVLRGNGYVVVMRDAKTRTRPVALIPVHASRCMPVISVDGIVVYRVSHPLIDGAATVTVPAEDMIHLRGYSLDGVVGIGPIEAATGTVGLSLAAQQHGERLFANGAQVTGILQYPKAVSQEMRTNLGESFAAAYAGVQNAGKVPILEEGATFQKVSLTGVESQHLETRRFQIEEVARLFRVPPHKIMDHSNANYNTLEAAEAAYDNDTILPLIRKIIAQFEDRLLFREEIGRVRLAFDHDLAKRVGFSDRMNAYQVALGNGIMSRNEVRALEGLPPVDGGDQFRVSANTLPEADADGDGIADAQDTTNDPTDDK